MKFKFLIPVFVLLAACSESKQDELSVEEAAVAMDEVATDMESDVVEMVNSEGTDALTDLLDLIDHSDFDLRRNPNQSIEQAKSDIKQLAQIFDPTSRIEIEEDDDSFFDESFDFEGNLGLYEWDQGTEEFVKSDVSIDYIEFRFPTEGSSTNNASFKLLDYQVDMVEFDELPTHVEAELYVDNTLEVSIDLSIDTNADGEISSASAEMFLSPFSYEVSVSQNGTSISLSSSISRGEESIVSASLSMAAGSGQNDLGSIDLNLAYRALEVSGSIELTFSEQESDPNDFMDISIFHDGDKLGDVVMVDDGFEYILMIQYNDGSQESLEDFFEPVMDELEDLLLEMERI